MHISFHGIYGIENIKIINKHRLELEEIHNTNGQFITPESHEKYKIFKDILYEIYNNNQEPIIMEHTTIPDDFLYNMNPHVQWFVDHKCCWGNRQFRLDRYYQLILDAPFGPRYMVIAVLKQVIYTNDPGPIRQLKWNDNELVIQTSIPTSEEIPDFPKLPSFSTVTERDQEFKDAYIVVRRKEEK